MQGEDWVIATGGRRKKFYGFWFLVFGVGEKKKRVRERWREPGGPRGWEAGRQPGTDQLQFFKEK